MARFDLNLLSALNALLCEKNVTRAAARLSVTQPTMSGMLQRLRYQFDDQLLIRNGRHLELTSFGVSLVEPVSDALRGVELLIQTEPVFDPATSTREFTVMASDYCTSLFLPWVVAYLATQAPCVRLVIRAIDSPIENLFSGEVDLCIITNDLSLCERGVSNEKVQTESLFFDEFVCIVAESHPLNERSGLKEFFSFPHVGVEMPRMANMIEASLRQHAPEYKPNVVVPDFPLVVPMVARSNLVGIIQARMVERFGSVLPVRTFLLPFPLPTLTETMLWHLRYIEDPAHIWFRGVVRDVAKAWLDNCPQSCTTHAPDC